MSFASVNDMKTCLISIHSSHVPYCEVFASVAFYVFKCQVSQVASKLLEPFSHLLDSTLSW
jgi:hypothetical protein